MGSEMCIRDRVLVALIAFLIFRFVGDPVNNLLGQEATVADRADLRERLGLDNPGIFNT